MSDKPTAVSDRPMAGPGWYECRSVRTKRTAVLKWNEETETLTTPAYESPCTLECYTDFIPLVPAGELERVVFVVTEGRHEYNNCAVFSTKELAEAYIAKSMSCDGHEGCRDDYDIQEWAINGEINAEVRDVFEADAYEDRGLWMPQDSTRKELVTEDWEEASAQRTDYYGKGPAWSRVRSPKSQDYVNQRALELLAATLAAQPEARDE